VFRSREDLFYFELFERNYNQGFVVNRFKTLGIEFEDEIFYFLLIPIAEITELSAIG